MFRLLCQMRPHCHPYPFTHAKMRIIRKGGAQLPADVPAAPPVNAGHARAPEHNISSPGQYPTCAQQALPIPARLRPGCTSSPASSMRFEIPRDAAARISSSNAASACGKAAAMRAAKSTAKPSARFFEASCPLLSWARRVEGMVHGTPGDTKVQSMQRPASNGRRSLQIKIIGTTAKCTIQPFSRMRSGMKQTGHCLKHARGLLQCE